MPKLTNSHHRPEDEGAPPAVAPPAPRKPTTATKVTPTVGISSWHVKASQPVDYEIRSCHRVFDPNRTDLLDAGGSGESRARRRFVVVDETVDRLYGAELRRYLDHHGVTYEIMVIQSGEVRKEIDVVLRFVERLDAFGIDRRREPVIVVGGGVVMDIVGLAASLYRRGTPFVRVPTTLVGLVDAGVGVKTGVNFNGHKNQLGTYSAAALTLLDRRFLSTLNRRHISNGLAEILKVGLIKDEALFDLLERYGKVVLDENFQGRSPEGEAAATAILEAAISGMLEELEPNLWEATLERSMDYGHTFSPAVEMLGLPSMLHGEAVCLDMALSTALACRRGLVDEDECARVFAVMSDLELPTWSPLHTPEVLGRALHATVRRRDGQQRLPLPVGIGKALFVNDVSDEELAAAIELQRAMALRGSMEAA
ncbi:sedoheptulose 7-phosphate cyclase [Amycolatopsis decaplanina]|uniref:2-epi-5-epi-valiolone synthase n=1 Tax=Amycolatopsis decaplanina DSM 44594 TaxID=1284240 RepID=M2ZY82_9PSEU|nr:sedoheptulose 7-phosphate cyclase [Amycolatopsis decaplanina]EME65653.1 2-epi-5-epi-valiolone synthase [Amycolatopsis decaplanina DSM 44594]